MSCPFGQADKVKSQNLNPDSLALESLLMTASSYCLNIHKERVSCLSHEDFPQSPPLVKMNMPPQT